MHQTNIYICYFILAHINNNNSNQESRLSNPTFFLDEESYDHNNENIATEDIAEPLMSQNSIYVLYVSIICILYKIKTYLDFYIKIKFKRI